jgi:LmbE family N-acetylglucosaminyl deacetylase
MAKRNSRRSATSILLILALAGLFQGFLPAKAQEIPPATTESTRPIDKAELHQALLDLTNPFTVMCVAAHPDDEDGTTLTALRRKLGVHTVSLFSTYGEGGQNAIGPELYEDLGVIRAKETMRASKIQGSEPHFLGLKDFGFSKSLAEALRIWGREESLRRMVLKIRELRPDVIITNHDTSRGHGHHQATGQLLIEAFDAAADPKRFPEQLAQLKPWQAQRLFVRLFGTPAADNRTATPVKVVAVDPNEIDPVRGVSFAEQALQALQQHATQGPWPKSMADMLRARRIESGKLPPIRYRLEREAPNAPALPNAPSSFLEGLKPRTSRPPLVIDGKPLTEFLDQPDVVLDALIKWRVRVGAELSSEDPSSEARVGNALARAAGLSIALSVKEPVLIRGEKSNVTITLANTGSTPVNISKLSFTAFGKNLDAQPPEQLLPETEATIDIENLTPANAPYTVPQADHLYDGLLFGARFAAAATIDVEGATFQMSTGLSVDVAPAIEIMSVSPSPCVRTEETLGRCRELSLSLSNHRNASFRGTIKMHFDRDAGLRTEVSRPLVMLPNQTGNESILTSNKIPRPGDLRGLRRSRTAVVSIYGASNEPVTERVVQLVYSNAHVKPDLRVGYIPSFDQTLEQSLAALGVESKALSVSDIQDADLSIYDTIILDNRAFEAHPKLIAANSRLLEFANSGGTLIVFYHKSNEWNPDPNKNRPQLAPYPIVLGEERVTDETALVSFLQPRHPLLNSPNRITQADFKDWIQERGLYYPKEWDNQYAALFAMNDQGEKPLRGGLLVGKYGKGNYIYTSMVWYRQLRGGVPGAYRMFANMISYGR